MGTGRPRLALELPKGGDAPKSLRSHNWQRQCHRWARYYSEKVTLVRIAVAVGTRVLKKFASNSKENTINRSIAPA